MQRAIQLKVVCWGGGVCNANWLATLAGVAAASLLKSNGHGTLCNESVRETRKHEPSPHLNPLPLDYDNWSYIDWHGQEKSEIK